MTVLNQCILSRVQSPNATRENQRYSRYRCLLNCYHEILKENKVAEKPVEFKAHPKVDWEPEREHNFTQRSLI